MKRALAVGWLVSSLVAPVARGAAAQEFEPFARSPDVRVPWELMGDPPVAAFPTRDRLSADAGGDFPILVIPAQFQDSPEPAVPASQIAEIVFATEGRTVTTFYEEMSGGRLTVYGSVPDWVRTHVPLQDAAGSVDGHGWIGDRAGEHFAAAIAAVDSVVDFGQFDNDGPDGLPNSGDDDGFVDAVTFKFTEVAGSCGGPGFWPHRSSLDDDSGRPGAQGLATQDTAYHGQPIRVLGYTTESVIECDGRTPQGPNTMAHEFGHILGLPDFYRAVEGIEATQRHWMVGCFGLMAAGSWGCGTDTRVWGFGPSGLSALSRWILGWDERVEVGPVRDTTYVLDPVQTGGQMLVLQLDPDGSELMLVEYRPLFGFDDVLPAGGILVYHVDLDANVFGGANATTFPYWLIEADGSSGLRRTLPDGGDRGVPADVFARAGAVDSLTPATWPNTHRVTGETSGVWIHSLAVEGGVARVRVSTTTALAGTAVVAPTAGVALEPFELRYRVDGGVGPYEAVPPPGGMPVAGLSARMDGAELVVEGVPLLAASDVALPLHVRDSTGDAWWREHVLDFLDAELTDEDLLTPLVAPTPGDADVRTYLDRSGNRDGAYDIGDLRDYVLRTGG